MANRKEFLHNPLMENSKSTRRLLGLWGGFLLTYILASVMIWELAESDRALEEDRCLFCTGSEESP